jgi:hypothetical protein
MYNESSKFVELLIEDNVIRKLDKQKSAANDYVQSVIDAHNIFNERNATVEELLSDPWVIFHHCLALKNPSGFPHG